LLRARQTFVIRDSFSLTFSPSFLLFFGTHEDQKFFFLLMLSFNQYELQLVVGLCSGIMLLLSHKGNELNVNRLSKRKKKEEGDFPDNSATSPSHKYARTVPKVSGLWAWSLIRNEKNNCSL
jgi:hypothetical protein